MAIYHIVLLKLTPNIDPQRFEEWKQIARGMVGQIPGLQRVDINKPDPSTAKLTQGFDMALMAVLDAPESLPVYSDHPAHLNVAKFGQGMFANLLAYDMEFTP